MQRSSFSQGLAIDHKIYCLQRICDLDTSKIHRIQFFMLDGSSVTISSDVVSEVEALFEDIKSHLRYRIVDLEDEFRRLP